MNLSYVRAMPALDAETKQPANAASTDANLPAKAPADNWDSLRGLTTGVPKPQRGAKVRTALFALLLILSFVFLGWFLHEHLPALIDFGKEVGDTVAKFASGAPKPSEATRSTAVPDQRSTHNKPHSKHVTARTMDSGRDTGYDPQLHPFYATALIGGRRVFLNSNDAVIVLDIASGQWAVESEAP